MVSMTVGGEVNEKGGIRNYQHTLATCSFPYGHAMHKLAALCNALDATVVTDTSKLTADRFQFVPERRPGIVSAFGGVW